MKPPAADSKGSVIWLLWVNPMLLQQFTAVLGSPLLKGDRHKHSQQQQQHVNEPTEQQSTTAVVSLKACA